MRLISVIMPSYNHGKYISEAIDSVLNQTISDLELIIVDDGSKDESKQIIEQFSKKDDRVKAFFHEKNMGIARTINDCIGKAQGKFVAFIDSDDVWVKDKLETQFKILEKNENLVVWSEGEIIDSNGTPTGKLFTYMHRASERKKSGNLLEELLKGNYVFGSSLILKKKNLGDIRFDESFKYLNDHKFEVDLASKFEYHFISEPLAMYRIHGKNSILSDRSNWQKDEILIGEYFITEYYTVMSNKAKSDVLLRVGTGYSNIGHKTKALKYILSSIKLNPLYPENIACLIIIFTPKDGFSRKVLRKLNGLLRKPKQDLCDRNED